MTRKMSSAATLTTSQICSLRMYAQHLIPGGSISSIPQILQACMGIQAQDWPAARLGLRARGSSLDASQIGQEALQPGIFTRVWAMRGTLHLLNISDARWLVPSLAPIFLPGNMRRMEQLGWETATVQKGLDLLRIEFDRNRTLTRQQIKALLADHHLPFEGQAAIHIIYRAAYEAILCNIPGKDSVYASFQEWIGKPLYLPMDELIERLIPRYLQSFGPATERDMAAWSGLKITDIRRNWEHGKAQLISVESDLGRLWALSNQPDGFHPLQEELHACRLIPAWDNYLIGYTSRDFAVSPGMDRYIRPGGGIIAPSLLIDGKVLGTWKLVKHGSKLSLQLTAYRPLVDSEMEAVEAEVIEISKFLGRQSQISLVLQTVET